MTPSRPTPQMSEPDAYVVLGRYSDGSGISDKAIVFRTKEDAEAFVQDITDIVGGGFRDAVILPAKYGRNTDD